MEKVLPFLPLVALGFGYTIILAVASIALAFAIGLGLGLLRRSNNRWVTVPVVAFVEVARGTSEIVQMYWVFFALPLFLAIQIPAPVAGILVLGINQGAYVSEIVRGAFRAVPRPQYESATALGFSSWVRFRRVTFPQALSIMLPSLGNTAVDTAKATAVVSLITVADLTFRVQQVRAATGETVLSFAIAMVLYLFLTSTLTFLFRRLERVATPETRVSRRMKVH